QFALAAANRRHGIDRLDTRLQRLVHGLAPSHARRVELERAAVLGHDLAFTVERPAERIDDAADQRIAAGNRKQLPGGADLIAFGDFEVVTEDDDANRRLF